jgi:hypothetical protein
MIVVCDPISRRFSHEKVNGGFLAALGEAFPGERIRLHADPTHVEALRDILRHDGVELPRLEAIPGGFADTTTLRGMLAAGGPLRRVLQDAADQGTDHVFFLAYNPVLLWHLKRLHRRKPFRHFRFTLVLHGEFEEIATDLGASPPTGPSGVRQRASLLEKLGRLRPWQLPGEVMAAARRRVSARWRAMVSSRQKAWLSVPRMLAWRHSDRYRYIALSGHMVENARRFVDVDALGVVVVTMPIVFAPPAPPPENAIPRFATFGYGDAGMLQQVLAELEARALPEDSYEIRVIGMDDRGLSGFRNVSAPSRGQPLSRAQMERLARDIDAFLILYRADKYRLSCSGSIFEAFSYLKPVLYFDTPCVAQFDDPASPIGEAAGSIREFVDNIERAARDPRAFAGRCERYRAAIMERRTRLGYANSLDALRRALFR